ISAVATVPARRVQRARDLVRAGTLLAAHVRRQDRPLRPEIVFDASTITDFASSYAGLVNKHSLSTYVSQLRAIQRGLGYDPAPPLEWEQRETIVYDDDEIEQLMAEIAAMRTAHKRRHLRAAAVLVFGAGYLPRELGWAKPEHL